MESSIMKAMVKLSVALVVLLAATPAPRYTAAATDQSHHAHCPPPSYDENAEAVLLPHPTNCSRFYICNHGYPVGLVCPTGLFFNPRLMVCDWPYHAGCKHRLHPYFPDWLPEYRIVPPARSSLTPNWATTKFQSDGPGVTPRHGQEGQEDHPIQMGLGFRSHTKPSNLEKNTTWSPELTSSGSHNNSAQETQSTSATETMASETTPFSSSGSRSEGTSTNVEEMEHTRAEAETQSQEVDGTTEVTQHESTTEGIHNKETEEFFNNTVYDMTTKLWNTTEEIQNVPAQSTRSFELVGTTSESQEPSRATEEQHGGTEDLVSTTETLLNTTDKTQNSVSEMLNSTEVLNVTQEITTSSEEALNGTLEDLTVTESPSTSETLHNEKEDPHDTHKEVTPSSTEHSTDKDLPSDITITEGQHGETENTMQTTTKGQQGETQELTNGTHELTINRTEVGFSTTEMNEKDKTEDPTTEEQHTDATEESNTTTDEKETLRKHRKEQNSNDDDDDDTKERLQSTTEGHHNNWTTVMATDATDEVYGSTEYVHKMTGTTFNAVTKEDNAQTMSPQSSTEK